MLRKFFSFFSETPEEREIQEAKEHMLCVSPQKPMGYLECGVYNNKKIRARCIAYFPKDLLAQLVKKEDVYIIARSEEKNGDEVRRLQQPLDQKEQKRVIFDETIANTFVIHKKALTDLLTLNKDLTLAMLNQHKELIGHQQEFKEIDESAVIAFVKFTGAYPNATGEAKALIDAAFADPMFLTDACKKSIVLTPELSEVFNVKSSYRFS